MSRRTKFAMAPFDGKYMTAYLMANNSVCFMSYHLQGIRKSTKILKVWPWKCLIPYWWIFRIVTVRQYTFTQTWTHPHTSIHAAEDVGYGKWRTLKCIANLPKKKKNMTTTVTLTMKFKSSRYNIQVHRVTNWTKVTPRRGLWQSKQICRRHPLEMRSMVNDCRQDHSLSVFKAVIITIVRFSFLLPYRIFATDLCLTLNWTFRMVQGRM